MWLALGPTYLKLPQLLRIGGYIVRCKVAEDYILLSITTVAYREVHKQSDPSSQRCEHNLYGLLKYMTNSTYKLFLYAYVYIFYTYRNTVTSWDS